MWPLLLDMTKDESIQSLRNLELEAYSHLVSALRAQGPLNPDKRKLLKETGHALNISQERHKAEVRRALSDEKLNTIAYHVGGQSEYTDDWAQEGRRVIPLMPRMAPQTAFSTIADELAENADQNNKQLPLPANTERKRSVNPPTQNLSSESNKSSCFRIPDMPKHEDKKRKFSETSSLAQHLLGPSKMSKIQQIYRQKTKAKSKELFAKVKHEADQQELAQSKIQHPLVLQKSTQAVKLPLNTPLNTFSGNSPKVNVLQNIHLEHVPTPVASEDQVEQVQDMNNFVVNKVNEQNHITSQTSNINDNLNSRLKLLTKSNNNIMFKSLTTSAGTNLNLDLQKTIKMCPVRKPITKTVPSIGQKLIVVSNAQTIPSSSILQRTLTIPFVKNISVKNFDKFKIVTTTSAPVTLPTSVVATSSFNSVKHKVVTVRTSNPTSIGKKAFPLTQFQMLNKGSIKVLPLGGKIVGKTSTTPSMYVVNSMGNMQPLSKSSPLVTNTKVSESVENIHTASMSPTTELLDVSCSKFNENLNYFPKVAFSKDNLSSCGDDYDAKIDEFHIQTVGGKAKEPSVEVQCESLDKDEEVIQNSEVVEDELICLPEADCLSSDAIIIDNSDETSHLELETRISPETMEVEIEEYTNDHAQITEFADVEVISSVYESEVTDIGYVEN